ncbi:MAG: hypothetical protein QXO12_03450 [Candidatus Pacearchaeota archaeon]
MKAVFETNSEIKKLDYTEEKKEDYLQKSGRLKKFEETTEEEEEPHYISWIWYLSFILLITADIFEFIFSIIGLASAGALSILGIIPLIFEIPGALLFLYLIFYYTKNGYLSQIEGGVYVFLVAIEFFGFIPIIGSLIEIAPIKTLTMLASRGRLWRVKRLRSLKKEVKKQQEEVIGETI